LVLCVPARLAASCAVTTWCITATLGSMPKISSGSSTVPPSPPVAVFIVNAATPDVIRLAPPLIVTQAQLQTFLDVLPGLLDGALEGTGS